VVVHDNIYQNVSITIGDLECRCKYDYNREAWYVTVQESQTDVSHGESSKHTVVKI
jgi:hypothetical protein